MRYHASWRNTKGWWVVCLFLSMPLLVAGATDRALWPMVLGMGPIVYLYAIGRRLSVEVDERGIRYQGWLTSTEANWKDVTGVTNAENFPYPRKRFYGPHCYEVRTSTRWFVINLLYFPPELRRAFLEEVQRRGLRRGRRKAV